MVLLCGLFFRNWGLLSVSTHGLVCRHHKDGSRLTPQVTTLAVSFQHQEINEKLPASQFLLNLLTIQLNVHVYSLCQVFLQLPLLFHLSYSPNYCIVDVLNYDVRLYVALIPLMNAGLDKYRLPFAVERASVTIATTDVRLYMLQR